MHVDEFIDELLHAERLCDIILPRLQVQSLPPSLCTHSFSHLSTGLSSFLFVLQKRQVLEEAEMLDPRISALEEDLDEVESSEEEDEEEEKVNTHFFLYCLYFIVCGICSAVKNRLMSVCSWRDPRPLNPTDVLIGTKTDLDAPHHLGIDGAAHPDGLCLRL